MTRRNRPAHTVGLLAIAVLLAMVGAACGSDDNSSGTTTSTRPVGASTGDGSTSTSKGEDPDPGEGTEVTTDTSKASTTIDVGAGGDPQAYVDALATSISSDGFVTEDQGRCLGENWLKVIGFDRIQGANLSPDDFAAGDGDDFAPLDLDADDGSDLYDQFGECGIDLAEMFMKSFSAGDLSPSQQDCFEEVLTDENIRKSFVADFVGDDSADPLEAAESCMIDG